MIYSWGTERLKGYLKDLKKARKRHLKLRLTPEEYSAYKDNKKNNKLIKRQKQIEDEQKHDGIFFCIVLALILLSFLAYTNILPWRL